MRIIFRWRIYNMGYLKSISLNLMYDDYILNYFQPSGEGVP